MEEKARGVEIAVFTKAELIKQVSALAGLTLKEAEVVVETVLETMVRTLRCGGKIEIRRFGSFRTRRRRARMARNPRTGAPVAVPAKIIPYFTPSVEIKRRLSGASRPETAGGQ
jgi:integration host factor subunit beta